MKKQKIIAILSTLLIFTSTTVSTTTVANAENIKSSDIDLVILFDNTTIDKSVENLVTNSGGKVINEFPDLGGIEVKCSANLIPTVKSLENVHSLAPNHVINLNNEKTAEFSKSQKDLINTSDELYEKYQWDIKRVTNDGKSFNLQSGNHNVTVGIIDSGVDINHPDLINNFLGGKNLVPAGFKDDTSETGDLTDINDRLGHGTNVAGVIAANGRIKGVAPNIGFKSYRVFNKNGETNATICSSAIISAVNDGVKVINLSNGAYDLKGKCYWTDPNTRIKYNLGDDMADYSLYKRAINYAIKNGVTVVSAAGNENLDCSNKTDLTNYLNNLYANDGFHYDGLTYELPGTIKGVITVSATGKNDKLAKYSNYGKNYINVTAPGGDITNSHEITDMCLTTSIDSGYTFTQGTSFSAPKVAAVAALIACEHDDFTPKLIAKKIYKTADKLGASNYYGAGMINAYNAIK